MSMFYSTQKSYTVIKFSIFLEGNMNFNEHGLQEDLVHFVSMSKITAGINAYCLILGSKLGIVTLILSCQIMAKISISTDTWASAGYIKKF